MVFEDNNISSCSSTKTSILMLPWLAHGHISPFLQLAKELTKRNFNIYFCSTSANLTSIKSKLTNSPSVQLVELRLPSSNLLPSHYHTTNGLPPHLMPALKKAFDMSSSIFSQILKTINPHLLIYDFLQPWAPAIASDCNIPAVEFLTSCAAISCYMTHAFNSPDASFPFKEIFLEDYEQKRFAAMKEASTDGTPDKDRVKECEVRSCGIILIRTFREIEGEYLDYLSFLNGKEMVPVGPLVVDENEEEDEEGQEIMEWLNNKEKGSVVFVSFGSEYFLSLEEIEEIAYGLELSQVNFIWVIRFEKGGTIGMNEALPKEGFMERVKDQGMVIQGWAPQLKVLKHKSVGGFVSHCGWSSVMEGMKSGVPIIAMPMQLDQPFNARVVGKVDVGVEVKRNENGALDRNRIAKIIRDVIVGPNGAEVRRRAKEMSENMRQKGQGEMDRVVNELLNLCQCYRKEN